MLAAHKDPEHMARVLVGYIDDDARVLSAVKSEFYTPMSIGTVARIRAERQRADETFARETRAVGQMQLGWDWRGDKHAEAMAIASDHFVVALDRERARAVYLSDMRGPA